MTRGHRPKEAIRLATRIAEKRGEAQQIGHGPVMICTSLISIAGLVAHVRIKRMCHIRTPGGRIRSPEVSGRVRDYKIILENTGPDRCRRIF